MRLAISAAQKSKTVGGAPIGAILIHESTGKLISAGESIVGVIKDPTAHAEINCIRSASHQLKTDNLFDYTLYSTLEPCHMCLSAAAWARIPRIYFGAYRKDVNPDLFDIKTLTSDEMEAPNMNLREKITMRVKGGILEEACASILKDYQDTVKNT